MSVFNPKILDASIRDVTTDLADEQKVDVLIYAMQNLKLERSVPCSRTLKAQLTLLAAPGTSSKTQSSRVSDCQSCRPRSRTRLVCCEQRPGSQPASTPAHIKVGTPSRLRATVHSRLTPVSRSCVCSTDLEAILRLDPDHLEARSLMGRSIHPGKVRCCICAGVVPVVFNFRCRAHTNPTSLRAFPRRFGVKLQCSCQGGISRCCFFFPTYSRVSPANFCSARLTSISVRIAFFSCITIF